MHPSQADKNTFGADVKLHPVTKRPLESGIGALPEHLQAENHCHAIEAEGNPELADKMRKELGIPTAAEHAAKHAEHAAKQEKLHAAVDQIHTFHDRISALEELVKGKASNHGDD